MSSLFEGLTENVIFKDLIGNFIGDRFLENWNSVEDLQLHAVDEFERVVEALASKQRVVFEDFSGLLKTHQMVDWATVSFISAQCIVWDLVYYVPLNLVAIHHANELWILFLEFRHDD